MKEKTNSLDIADRAGVSQATVSRALRGSPLVSRETRLRIEAIARELNYKVDKSASNLRTQRSKTLALLLFEDPTSDDSQINPFFLSMLGSITRACAEVEYDLLVSFQQLSQDWQADYENCHRADGLILLGYGDFVEYRSRLEGMIERGAHYVRWGPSAPDGLGLSIGCDNRHGGREMTEHLLAQGRRRIAFLGQATNNYPEFLDRYLGHTQALQAAGITPDPALQADAITTESSGYEAAQKLLDEGVRFDAIFAASDLIAIGAMQALEDAGLQVPGDIAVAGFDDIPAAGFVRPRLTTVRQDTQQAGRILVASLIKQISEEPVSNQAIMPRLIVRNSCGASS
ncbi:MAG: LacI family DNA-binding transcriptional regulator [Wenzhouxiangellaceae bacterium]